jgi:hypothetical protein
MLEKYQRVIDSTKTYEIFKHSYPDIHLYVDLTNHKFLIESNYIAIRNKLFELITCCEMEKAVINFDTARKRVQVKEARIKKGFSLNNMDFFECYIEGDIKDCLFENCKIRNSNLQDNMIYSNNDIKYSNLANCKYGGFLNEIKSSYIVSNPNDIINANLSNCIVLNGNFSQESKIDKYTELINQHNIGN